MDSGHKKIQRILYLQLNTINILLENETCGRAEINFREVNWSRAKIAWMHFQLSGNASQLIKQINFYILSEFVSTVTLHLVGTLSSVVYYLTYMFYTHYLYCYRSYKERSKKKEMFLPISLRIRKRNHCFSFFFFLI